MCGNLKVAMLEWDRRKGVLVFS